VYKYRKSRIHVCGNLNQDIYTKFYGILCFATSDFGKLETICHIPRWCDLKSRVVQFTIYLWSHISKWYANEYGSRTNFVRILSCNRKFSNLMNINVKIFWSPFGKTYSSNFQITQTSNLRWSNPGNRLFIFLVTIADNTSLSWKL
jgi:hypothetical protein